VLWQGAVPGRDKDVAGLFAVYGQTSSDLCAAQREQGQPTQTYESIVELNYTLWLMPGLNLQPDLQG
jgi:hypothetical protein